LYGVIPDINVDDLAARLSDRSRRFVWVRRSLTDDQRSAIQQLSLAGVMLEQEPRRIYPQGKLAGHFLGLTDIDGNGIEGAEAAYDDLLKQGGTVRVTLDADVQIVLEEEFDKASADFDMKGAAGIVLDAATGDVRALASWPSTDPAGPRERTDDAKRNRALGAVYELGSVYIPLTVAAGLETGAIRSTDSFDVSQPVRIGAVTVRDARSMSASGPTAITPADIVAYSSNIGAAQIAERIGVAGQQAFLARVGLLSRPSYAGPQASNPLPPKNWNSSASTTVSYGYGIAVSPLQFALAFAPFANGGAYVKPRFLAGSQVLPVERTQAMSASTARSVLDMMRQAVVVGTGRSADAPGYQVAGKTGSAEKPAPQGYDPDRLITSFAAVFPSSRPQFVVLIVLDEAQARRDGQRTGANAAASIAGKVISRAAPLLDVAPIVESPGAQGGPTP
jgi:cell division protein FtsI (penicillin-binding protein 3)